MRKLIVTIDPRYVNYIITVNESGKTTVKINIDKTGLPENAKKVNISYIYLKKEIEEDVPQPATGTIATVGESINIDENTEYPIVGEFELDGIPASIEGIVSKKVIYSDPDTTTFTFAGWTYYDKIDNEDPNCKLEWVDGETGIGIKGSKKN